MAYKITIPKRGQKAGEVTIESLDSTSCNTVQEISQHYGTVRSITPINHGDDVPVHDSINIVE
jgi:hypothetical protein